MPRVHILPAAISFLLVACGLNIVGQATPDDAGVAGNGDSGGPSAITTDDSGSSTSSASDASGPSPLDDAGVVASGCDAGAGAGATIVAIVPRAAATACPAGSTELTFHSEPQVAAGACSCGTCTATKEPSCAGNFQLTYGLSNSCSNGPLQFNVQDGVCTNFNQGTFTITDYHGWGNHAPAAGACTAPSIADVAKVTTTTTRACIPNVADAVCKAAEANERLCTISTDGTCTGSVFTVSLHVGDGPSVTCAACGCSRAGAGCAIEYHSNNTCTGLRYTANANSVCTRTNNNTNVTYFKTVATSPTCNPTPGAATAIVTNPRALCCTP